MLSHLIINLGEQLLDLEGIKISKKYTLMFFTPNS